QLALVVVGAAVHGLPGRHLPRLRVVLDVAGPIHGLLVGQERERPDLAGAVAALAVVLEDGQYVAVVGDRAVLLGRLLLGDRAAAAPARGSSRALCRSCSVLGTLPFSGLA